MPRYHFTYASTTPMPDDREVVAEIMQAWEAWFAQLGPDVIDPGGLATDRGALRRTSVPRPLTHDRSRTGARRRLR